MSAPVPAPPRTTAAPARRRRATARAGAAPVPAALPSSPAGLVHAPKQARGVARQQGVIDSGLALLQVRSLDEITMEQVARGAGCSVGNLYKRFASKDALLQVLVGAVRTRLAGDIDAMAASVRGRSTSLADAVRDVIAFEVAVFRRYRGLIRGVSLHRMLNGHVEGPGLRDIRERFCERAAATLLPLMPATGRPAEGRRKLDFAIQASLGCLLEMTVLDGGPRGIDDRDLVERLSAMVSAYLAS